MPQDLNRKRSSSTLANTISFIHTRQSEDHDRQKNPSSPFGYLNKNSSSSTVHSITQTLSNVGFNLVNHPSTHSPDASALSIPNKKESPLTRAKLFAKIKTKELGKKSKADTLHQHNFLKINSAHHHHNGLSSSASNSKVLDSGSTLYSFDTSSSNIPDSNIMKHLNIYESNIRNLSVVEKDQIADTLWSIFTSKIIPLFKVDNNANSLKLKASIEDLNRILEVFLRFRIENKVNATSLISEIQEYLKNGLKIMENELSFQESDEAKSSNLFYRLSMVWEYFFPKIYHYLLAILLPLQLELEKEGKIVKPGSSYWDDIADSSSGLSTKKIILTVFRDYIVIPYFAEELNLQLIDESDRKSLIQCFGMLKSIQSSNYNQKFVEHVSTILEQGLGSFKQTLY